MLETLAPQFPLAAPPAATADSDQALVEAWVTKADSSAFEEIVALHQAYVFRVALSVLGPGGEAEAEDVAQEAFIRASRSLQDFRGESRLRTWLHRLALNLALDRRRRSRWRRPHVDIAVLERQATADWGDDPFASAAAVERRRLLHECLEALPDSLRRVIHLRYWLEMPIEEIARTLHLPVGTVKSHLHRSRTVLYRAMEARGSAGNSR